MTPRRFNDNKKGHRFGGEWTTQKLDILSGYLNAYTKALRNKPSPQRPFHKIFVDAFAGTGYRTDSRKDAAADPTEILFPDLADAEPQKFLAGSAKRALQTEPPFDRYLFIERDAVHCDELKNLKDEFPDRASSIEIQRGDANEKIQIFCKQENWNSQRAVLFLDPYGMQVEWETIAAIAATEAIDLWLLFPLGIGVNRLLPKSGNIPDAWQRRLNSLLGTEDWYDAFYHVERQSTLFGEEDRMVKEPIDKIGQYFNKRLKSVFPGVAEKPAILSNSKKSPLYLLCFAAANEKGAPIALKIANHLLKGMR